MSAKPPHHPPASPQEASPSPAGERASKTGLHPANRHRTGYDFALLAEADPGLAACLITTPTGATSIDFANPEAVKALNRALLKSGYGIQDWDLPPGYLCPPIPGRADYLLHLADLLAAENKGRIPLGPTIRVLDIGVGANGIYPLLGTSLFDWQFVGTDIDGQGLDHLRTLLRANPEREPRITLRQQEDPAHIFEGVVEDQEYFEATLCNPPFHDSADTAAAGSRRKWRQLGHEEGNEAGSPLLNFAGQPQELWCEGGEVGFLARMIQESRRLAGRCLWHTSLLSRGSHLDVVEALAREAGAVDFRIVPMAQGQKQSRFVAWSFLGARDRNHWRQFRWAGVPTQRVVPRDAGETP